MTDSAQTRVVARTGDSLRARAGGRRAEEPGWHGHRTHPLRLPARGFGRLHGDDAAHVRRPQGLAAGVGDGAALSREGTRHGLRGVRDRGGEDRPDRAGDRIGGPLEEEQRRRLLEIADMCPVHRTLESEVVVENRLVG